MKNRTFSTSLYILAIYMLSTHLHAANNILVIVADDLGIDMLPAVYQTDCTLEPATCENGLPIITTSKIKTDNIMQLAQNGVTFKNVWSNPYCSPTRATIQTGRYGYQTDVGFAGHILKLSETTLPEVLATKNYSSSAIGKWHLAGGDEDTNDPSHPTDTGYDYYAGTLSSGVSAHNGNFYSWYKTSDNGTENVFVSGYAPEDKVQDASNWIQTQSATANPWFMWFSFNLPHGPFHVPPTEQFSNMELLNAFNALSASDQEQAKINCKDIINVELCYIGMVEAMDYHMGELLSAVSESDTTVIFLGDNGTPSEITQPLFGFSNAKGTVFEHGVHVPMIIKSPDISQAGREGKELDILVNTTDLYSTILELAGITNTDTDTNSISFSAALTSDTPQNNRAFLYAEVFRFDELIINGEVLLRNNYEIQQAVMNQNGFKTILLGDDVNFDKFGLVDGEINYFYNYGLRHETLNIYFLVEGRGPNSPNTFLANFAELTCELGLMGLEQQADTFFSGKIVDENSIPLYGARIDITNFSGSHVEFPLFTSSDGFYMSKNLPFNFYRLDISMPGFVPESLITRNANCREPNNFTLVGN